MRKLIVVLVVGMMATSAGAGQLSMRWAGNAPGDFEKTLLPGQTASIEIVWTMEASDVPKAAVLNNLDGRFFVWGSEPVAPAAIGSTDIASFTSVTSVTPVAPGFVTGASVGIGGPLENLFWAYNNGALIVGNGTVFDTVIGTIDLQCQGEATAPVLISYNVIPPSPGAYFETTPWTHRWQYSPPTYTNGPRQFRIGDYDAAWTVPAAGNPGDAASDWSYHGYETFTPLVLHQIPEPASLALLVVGGLAMIRRRCRLERRL
ncbi:MAG: PEP-CTERM sorting domain-containing protein [Phycisphaerales bacterium]|nr:MAG: PEP-CTERM sorting domain-containing protein [Phycisphaerales bacterium]